MNENVQHVFMVGAKSLGTYGGYETFVDIEGLSLYEGPVYSEK